MHGAAGGVGTAAIQLGRALGLRMVAVVGDDAKKEFALRCGANHAVLSDGWLALMPGRPCAPSPTGKARGKEILYKF